VLPTVAPARMNASWGVGGAAASRVDAGRGGVDMLSS